MKAFKILFSAIIFFGLIGSVSAQTKKSAAIKKTKTKVTKFVNKKPIAEPIGGEIKILAEGAYSKVETPFIFAARDAETYARLQGFVENLPSASEIDFTKSAVAAAFAGTKNTGGYSVSIKNSDGEVSINLVNPPKDAMTAQVITAPFKIALVPLGENDSLNLEVSAGWKNAARIYKITSGAFEYSGGFAGRQKKFDVEGTIGVLSFGDCATLVFNLSGTGAEKARKLTETASGSLNNGTIKLTRLDAVNFAENPKPPLAVFGTISNDKLLLSFEPLPSRIADAFQSRGKIEAVIAKQR